MSDESIQPTPEDVLPLLQAMRKCEMGLDGRQGVPARTFSDLDWGLWTTALAQRCQGPETARHAAALGLLPQGPVLEERRAHVAEATEILERGERIPLGELRDLEEPLRMAARSDLLAPTQLLDILRTLECATDAVRSVGRLGHKGGALRRLTALLDPCLDLQTRIDEAVDRTGELKDTASALLGELRKKAAQLRRGILARLDAIVKSPRFEGILQDDFITLRDERYVLPVRAGERGDFPGIVHGQSGSGATLFIEPQELVDANNQLRLAQLEVVNEERRILRALTALVSARLEVLERNRLVLVLLDLTLAVASMAQELDLQPLEVVDPRDTAARIELRQARHPVLVLKAEASRASATPFEVIANDILVTEGARGLVISGPNTGGKTVSLKTVGFFALLARAGLPAPVERGSVLPLFRHIYSDIGDEQGLEHDLSTFSAHVANIASFLPQCGPDGLVLLDELFAGTDPEQGAALGRALLLHLAELGTFQVTTTHLESLKTMAFEHDAFVCASVGFDLERLAPSYRLRHGVPGASYALRIAERIGLSPVLVRRAAAQMEDRFTVDREALIARMDAEHRALQEERREVEAERLRLARETQRAKETTERLRKREESALAEEERRLRDEVRRLEKLVKEQARTLRGLELPTTAEAADEVRERIEEAREVAREASDRARERQRVRKQPGGGLAYESLRVGLSVQVASFGRAGTVLSVPPPGEKIPVQVGSLRAAFSIEELAPTEAPAEERHAAPHAQHSAASGNTNADAPLLAPARSDASATVDLRGARVDDALEHLSAAIDRARDLDLPAILIIHGHGTGALRDAVRKALRENRDIARFRTGERTEGGDGVTIAGLRAGG